MALYLTANKSLVDNQKAIRMAPNILGTVQKWFYNIVDVPLDQFILAAIYSELLNAFKIPNRDQIAWRQLRNLR